MLDRCRQPDHAAWCYARLQREFADVACRDGKTGKELFDALPEEGAVRRSLQAADPWPIGKVEIEKKPSFAATANPSLGGYRFYALPYEGDVAPFFSELTLRFDQNTRTIVGRDGLGGEAWKPISPFEPEGQQDRQRSAYYGFDPSQISARVCGHLLLVSLGSRLMAVDTLGDAASGPPKVLWSQDLADDGPSAVGAGRLVFQLRGMAMRWQQLNDLRYYNGRACSLGPVTDQYVCFQRYRDLVAADPQTGKTLWVRRGAALGSTLLGDDQFVFVLPPGRTEALVLRASDGELLGNREVPQFKQADFLAAAPQMNLAVGIPMMMRGNADPSAADGSEPVELATLGRRLLFWREDRPTAVAWNCSIPGSSDPSGRR